MASSIFFFFKKKLTLLSSSSSQLEILGPSQNSSGTGSCGSPIRDEPDLSIGLGIGLGKVMISSAERSSLEESVEESGFTTATKLPGLFVSTSAFRLSSEGDKETWSKFFSVDFCKEKW